MSRTRIEEILRLMEDGFEASQFSLIACLRSVDAESWTRLPAGGHRPIRDLVYHVGMFKFMYANHAFGDGSYVYERPPATPPPDRLATRASAISWLREGHEYLTGELSRLGDDAELAVERKAHWGAMVPTEVLVTIMLQHDLFHGGEINHARAVLQDQDRWYVPGRPETD